jgi:glycosidase
MSEKRLTELDWATLTSRSFHPSPLAWEDQVLYFLLLDRFSNGSEQGGHRNNANAPVSSGSTPLFDLVEDYGNATETAARGEAWWGRGCTWLGGTLQGLESKLGYLKRLGITALWVSPVFKQVTSQESYHGYGIQNFLDVDRHFGTRDELEELVRVAHSMGIYVVLDVILNHAGDVFEYDADRHPETADDGTQYMDPRWDDHSYRVAGFRARGGKPRLPFEPIDLSAHPSAWPDGAVWPAEFQAPDAFTCKGRISNWEYDPEHRQGDFFGLKNLHHGVCRDDGYAPSDGLIALCEAFKFWIAFADVDGFRVDTVKHMDRGAARFFSSSIHEFAQSIGKENFYLIGEITGGRAFAFEVMQTAGLNAALGINDVPRRLEGVVRGRRPPQEYFDLFRNSEELALESHAWFRNTVVTMFDDHDQVGQSWKRRFCAEPGSWRQLVNAVALNATTLGIPCIYYGTEQGFDGGGGDDRALREAMFGGEFGSLESRERHFFNEENWIYRGIRQVLRLRKTRPALRRGRQYLRQISGDGRQFGYPEVWGGRRKSIVAWSRLYASEPELVVAINTDCDDWQEAWVTVDHSLHRDGDLMHCVLAFAPPGPDGVVPEHDRGPVKVEPMNGKAVRLRLPPAGLVVYE